MRALMIDCSRLIERHGYYRELVEQIAAWGYDALLLHFCDDHGLSGELPGFEDLAAPHAIPAAGLRELVALGRRHGVRVIPEIECFGHARWLVGHRRWDACFAGDRDDRELRFNAVDPALPLTAELMHGLIGAACAVFDDEVVHIGCDEVDLSGRCAGDPGAAWSGWVNRLIAMVHARGRRAMLWSDHLERDERIAAAIDKRAIAVSWHYGPDDDGTAQGMRRLRDAGFRDIVAAPAIQCWTTRLHAMERNLINVRLMQRHAGAVGAIGTIDTIWCPFRHLQGAMWHGIAAAARIHRTGELPCDDGAEVAELLFGGGDAATRRLCRDLPRLECHHGLFQHLWNGTAPGSGALADAGRVVALGAELLPAVAEARVPRHADRLRAMLLSARCAVHLARRLLSPEPSGASRRRHEELLAELESDWDATRFADDPARREARWGGNSGHNYLLPLMRRLAA